MTWDLALDAYEAEQQSRRRLKGSTLKGYRCHLRNLAVSTGVEDPRLVTRSQVTDWLLSSGASRHQCWVAARSFYAWATLAGLVAATPVPESGRRRPGRPHEGATSWPALWVEPVNAWSASLLAAGRSPRGVSTMSTYLRMLAEQHPDPWRVAGADLAALMSVKQWAPETRKSARTAFRSFYRHAVATGTVDASPAEELHSVRVPRGLPRPVADDVLLQTLDGTTDMDQLLVLLGAYAGLRCVEIAAVRPATDLQDGFLYVRGKGGDERRVPVHPALAQALDAEADRRAAGGRGTGFRWSGSVVPDGWLFPAASGPGHITAGAVSRRLGMLLPGRWTAHTLRHRFASSAYATTRDLRAVQELLGHASPATTARYTAMPDDALRAAVLGIA